MRQVAEICGLDALILRDAPDRGLAFVDPRPLEEEVLQVLEAYRPTAVITFGPRGINGHPDHIATHHLVLRAVLAARDRMPAVTIVAVPLVSHGDEIHDALLRARVAAAYGVTHLLATGSSMLSGGGPRVLVPRDLAYDSRDGQWRSRDDIPPRHRRLSLSQPEIDNLLDRGVALPEWHTPPAVAREMARARPPRHHRGLVVFFTGLSGAGLT